MPTILCVPYDDPVDGMPRSSDAYGAGQLTR
jgi:hypothetical protein